MTKMVWILRGLVVFLGLASASPALGQPVEELRVVPGDPSVEVSYEVQFGPWKTVVRRPTDAEFRQIAERGRGLLGIVLILGLAALLSTDRRAISRRVVFWGLVLQWVFALIVLRVPAGERVLFRAGEVVRDVLASALEGAEFMFGRKLVDGKGPGGFVFAFQVLPTVIFVAALFAVLYHLGVMRWIMRALGWVMARVMGTSGAESLNVAASLFLGQTEAPLTIRPYLSTLTKSELLTVMTSGMAHVSGASMAAYITFGVEPRHILTSVIMTAPGAILLSKMLVPETGTPQTLGRVPIEAGSTDANVLDAAARGTRDGLHLALNIAAMLIAFLSLVALVNKGLGLVGLSLQGLLGHALFPVAYLLGVPWDDCRPVGALLGTRTILNEMVAFGQLEGLRSQISRRSFTIATFALCGFANLGSVGVQLGGIGSLAPELRADLARLGFRALLAGTLANFLSACIAGVLL